MILRTEGGRRILGHRIVWRRVVVIDLPRRGPGRPPLTPAQLEQRREDLVRGAIYVRTARERLGTPLEPMTQERLAELLGVSRTLVAEWERGARPLRPKHREAVERLLSGR